jgi:hypothetical protein
LEEEKEKQEAEKQQQKEADGPDPCITDHINVMNSGGEGGDDPEVEIMDGDGNRDEMRSPKKKKKKSSKKETRKERKSARKGMESTTEKPSRSKKGTKRGKPSEDKGEDPIEETGGSTLCEGRFSTARSTPGKKVQVREKPPHDHKFKREYVEGSVVLSQDDHHTEFTMKLRGLLKEGQKVDEHLAIVPAKKGSTTPVLTTPNEIPLNQTDLGANVNVDTKSTVEKKHPMGKDSADLNEEDWPDPEVWFSFVVASDVDPEEILDRIRHEWKKNGGRRLGIKDLKTHHQEGSIVLYHLYNQGSEETIASEGIEIPTRAKEEELSDNMVENFKWANVNIPEFTLALKVPNIPGQGTSKMNKVTWRMKNMRKAYHLVCDKSHVPHLQDLMAIAKDRNLVAPIWGKQVNPSNTIANFRGKWGETPSWQIQHLKSFTKHHVNFHASMIEAGFDGIWDLDKAVTIYNVTNQLHLEGYMCLWTIMYTKLKPSDGHPLLTEIHQKQAMGDMEAVIPNVAEAATMVAMINKNVVAYLLNYLVDAGMPTEFVTDLLKSSCDASLFHSAGQCTWDKET